MKNNGIIIYSSATNDISYGDQYAPFLLRFNPSDNTYEVAESHDNFVLSQPEVAMIRKRDCSKEHFLLHLTGNMLTGRWMDMVLTGEVITGIMRSFSDMIL